ncbi:hypothetical protein CCC_00232 [Paramagnetospirillum magnetotacticum MS-1]|uniref:Uncharacterized protein n=1 Tax=Paramagnetospirillum magnetotacticum MS-1 TaxID=272627 RepID=A0A0C2UWJ0_PARME|nr:hypothetical protein [Paramagnetospirillum magnetotacticum]KIL97171.1 hypothetical protein CCC_00232 [Paramagnetospirillum magnetotacticum MS-1]
MTLHQLTHTASLDFGFPFAETLRRAVIRVQDFLAARRLESELARLDHREIADLAWRR